MGIEMLAPMRKRLSKIGSAPTNLMAPPVSRASKPISSMSWLKEAWISKWLAAFAYSCLGLLNRALCVRISLLLVRVEDRDCRRRKGHDFFVVITVELVVSADPVRWYAIPTDFDCV